MHRGDRERGRAGSRSAARMHRCNTVRTKAIVRKLESGRACDLSRRKKREIDRQGYIAGAIERRIRFEFFPRVPPCPVSFVDRDDNRDPSLAIYAAVETKSAEAPITRRSLADPGNARTPIE